MGDKVSDTMLAAVFVLRYSFFFVFMTLLLFEWMAGDTCFCTFVPRIHKSLLLLFANRSSGSTQVYV